MTDYVRHLDILEHVPFPRQKFLSSSFVLRSSDCSLCNGPFHECDHIAGFPYNGEFCVEIVRDVSAIDHVAIVDYPVDKRCWITSFSEDGFEVDPFTLRRAPRDNDRDNDKTTARAIIMAEQ